MEFVIRKPLLKKTKENSFQRRLNLKKLTKTWIAKRIQILSHRIKVQHTPLRLQMKIILLLLLQLLRMKIIFLLFLQLLQPASSFKPTFEDLNRILIFCSIIYCNSMLMKFLLCLKINLIQIYCLILSTAFFNALLGEFQLRNFKVKKSFEVVFEEN